MAKIDQLINNLQSNDESLQAQAAEELTALGEQAQAAILHLVKGCDSRNEGLQNWCNAALERVGEPSADQISSLIELADSDNSDMAFWAITLLGRAKTSAAVPILTKRLDDKTAPELQKRADWALKKIRS